MVNPRFLVVVAALAATGCKTEATATAYLSDIQAAVTGETLTTEARLSIPMPSMDKCGEYTPTITAALAPHLGNLRSPQCRQAGMDTLLDVTFDAAVLASGEDRDNWPILAVAVTEAEDAYRLALAINEQRVSAARAAVEEQLRGAPRANLEESRVTVSLANDLADTAEIAIGSAFVGTFAVPFEQTFEVRRREELQVVFSDVTTARLFRTGETEFGLLFKAQAQ